MCMGRDETLTSRQGPGLAVRVDWVCAACGYQHARKFDLGLWVLPRRCWCGPVTSRQASLGSLMCSCLYSEHIQRKFICAESTIKFICGLVISALCSVLCSVTFYSLQPHEL